MTQGGTHGGCISLRGVAVHNLKAVDVDIPRRRLVVICGLSGSGKSSLALDTLYAEGQRRFIETFSPYTRQFLEQCPKPEAERIDGIPPAVAVARRSSARSGRSTVSTATETADYLRLLYAKIGRIHCLQCGQEVVRDSPETAAAQLDRLPPGTRFVVGFAVSIPSPDQWAQFVEDLRQEGFVRAVAGGRFLDFSQEQLPEASALSGPEELLVVVDRLSAGSVAPQRLRESLELAFARGEGRAVALVALEAADDGLPEGVRVVLQGRPWRRVAWSNRLACETCRVEYPVPEPRLFSFNSSLGACPTCEGFGNVYDIDPQLVIPEPNKSLRDGAIAPWRTAAYEHELKELLALAGEVGLDVDRPWKELDPRQQQIVWDGVPERKFGGLRGFFQWLERRKYKTHLRAFAARWKSSSTCPACQGRRLRPEALAVRVGGKNLAEVHDMQITGAAEFLRRLKLTDWEYRIAGMILDQVQARLHYLEQVGLGYLTLGRSLRTLSGGEAQRVALTGALGSSLVNMLYVLDEPSIGLHPRDTDRLIQCLLALRQRGNSVVVVEHEEAVLRAADQVIEIGPGAGERGGQMVFQGTPAELEAREGSATGDYLSGRRRIRTPATRRKTDRGWLRLTGCRGHNLKNITLEIPLGLLCVVTGVSGSGKSTLVEETLYPALLRRLRKEGPRPLEFDELLGAGQIDEVMLIDQTPIGRSPRSNPVTYLKAFDAVREVFAETIEARTHNYTPSHFSFNSPLGRCEECKGDGYLEIDMQFLADVYVRCNTCGGTRYRQEILDATYRGKNIAEVLQMTVREALIFFRGKPKVQARLQRLVDLGLEYLRLGQPANTLSGGEAQRLKLAAQLSAKLRSRVLFLLDEPTTGLHFADIVPLLDTFDALLAGGHSVVVVEHNLHLMRAADYVIDLGPGAAEEGGRIVARGTPEEVAKNPRSITGQFLARALEAALEPQSV